MTCCNFPGKALRQGIQMEPGSKPVEAILNPSLATATSRCSPKCSNGVFVSQKQIWSWSLTGNWRSAVQFWRHGVQLPSRTKLELLVFREQFTSLFYCRTLYAFLSLILKGLLTMQAVESTENSLEWGREKKIGEAWLGANKLVITDLIIHTNP